MNLLKKISKIKNIAIEESFFFQCIFVLFWDLALISGTTVKSNVITITVLSILLNILFLYSFVTTVRFKIVQSRRENFHFNPYLLIIVAIFIISFTTILHSWFNYDGHIYYSYIRALKEWDFKWSTLMLAGHMSQGYTIFLMIGEFIFPDNAIGVKIIHCFMAIVTIYSFYHIIRELTSKNEKEDYTETAIYTAIFSLSPLLLGIIGELNTDFPVLCFYVWMVSYGVRKKHIGEAICGFLLCFSKETGCLLYGFYILGKIVSNIMLNRKRGAKGILKGIFCREILLFVSGGIIWLINYIYNKALGIGWAQNTSVSGGDTVSESLGHKLNSIALYPEYILQKVRQLLFINFSWIMYALIVCALFCIIWNGINKYKNYIKCNFVILMEIIFSFVSFLCYNFFYITFNHYRYLMPFVFFVSVGVVLAICVLIKKIIIRKTISMILVCLLFVSNFYSIDPVAEQTFMKEYTGDDNILIPCTTYIQGGDTVLIAGNDDYGSVTINTSAIYNFQAHHLSNCFNKMLEQLNYNEKTLIVLPCEYQNANGVAASIFGVSLSGYGEYYWDTEGNCLNINCVEDIEKMKSDSRFQRLNYRIVNSISEISQEEKSLYERIYYAALPFQKNFDHKKFLDGTKSELIDSVQYISWKWDIYQIVV